jgi:hypothetical protein
MSVEIVDILCDEHVQAAAAVQRWLPSPSRAGWPVIREICYDNFGRARPNPAHLASIS